MVAGYVAARTMYVGPGLEKGFGPQRRLRGYPEIGLGKTPDLLDS
jgi:hypothetical protein